MKGHVKIARKSFESDILWLERRRYSRWEAWVDMIQLAQWRPFDVVSSKYGVVRLDRGEFVASIRTLADRWNWGIQSVRSFVSSPIFSTRIATQRQTGAGTVYLIVNYDAYQSGGGDGSTAGNTESNNGLTQDQHSTNTRTSSKAVKAVKHTTSPEVAGVLEHFRTLHPLRRPSAKDERVVEKALALGYSTAELMEAITGNAHDPWHAERRKHELSYVLRDAEHIDSARAKAGLEPPDPFKHLPGYPELVDADGCLTPYGDAATAPR